MTAHPEARTKPTCWDCKHLNTGGASGTCSPCLLDNERGKGLTGHEANPRGKLIEFTATPSLNGLNTSKPGEGLRYNKGKRRFDLIPPDALAALADLFTIGARKYAERNWEKGMDYSNVIQSLDRHWNDFKAGIDRDPETGCLHITHVVWNAMALLTFQLRGIGTDNRCKVAMPNPPESNL